jgi:hypothetical protein
MLRLWGKGGQTGAEDPQKSGLQAARYIYLFIYYNNIIIIHSVLINKKWKGRKKYIHFLKIYFTFYLTR